MSPSFEFDIGSFRGRPSYLMRSKKGFCWDNLPPSLLELVTLEGMAEAVEAYALGPNGLYWLQYANEDGGVSIATAPGLWKYLKCDDSTGPTINRLEFGQLQTYWSTYCWAGEGEGEGEGEEQVLNQSIHYNNLPLGLVNQITELSTQGFLTEYSDIGFLAMGKDNSWILESKGWIWSEGIDPGLLAAIQEVDESVNAVNVRLSTVQTDCWWIEYSDGSTHFQVPAHWNEAITEYASLQYALKKQPRTAASVGRSLGQGLAKAAPVITVASAAACVLM
ncbi:hypothetical protein DFP73DRAFT_522548 [Morchella snyderi]|nr:hypothetical protein DFP73DRAFT_522548 [Morchella snyderi]